VTRIEERYRRVLRLLPASYRRQWEDEMVATFLESVERDDPEDAEFVADYGRPSWSEVASVVTLAVRLRLGTARLRLGAAGATPRHVAWGEAVRLVALVMLLAHAVAVGIDTLSRLWLTGRISWPVVPAVDPAALPPVDLWQAAASVSGFVWLSVYLALVLGQRRVAQVLALPAFVLGAVGPVWAAVQRIVDGAPGLLLTLWSELLIDAVLVLALLAFHRDAPPPRRRPWLVALAAGIAVVPALALTVQGLGPVPPPLDFLGLCCLALVAAAGAHLAGPVLGWGSRTPSWSLALALLAGAALVLRLVTLLDVLLLAPFPGRGSVLATGFVEAVAVLAVGAPLTRLAVRALRRLPAVPASPATPSAPTS
jgi:hypothetical protein